MKERSWIVSALSCLVIGTLQFPARTPINDFLGIALLVMCGYYLHIHWMVNVKTKTKIAETEVGKNPEYYQRTIDFHTMIYKDYCKKYSLKF